MAYLDAIRDAGEHYDSYFERAEALEKAEAEVRDEITTAFTVSLTKMPAKSLAVPSTDNKDSRRWIESGTPMVEAILDQVQSGYVDDELITALEKSTCPHVAALRLALANSWARNNAGEVAECRVIE